MRRPATHRGRHQAELAGHQQGGRPEDHDVVDRAGRSRSASRRRAGRATGASASSRTASSQGSPSAVTLPRSTTRPMLSAPIRAAIDWPSERPAATTTRRAASSPASSASATSLRVRVAGRGQASCEPRVRALGGGLGRGPDDRPRAGHGLEAAEAAAAALGAVVDDHGVADLAGAEAVAVEELAPEDDAGADAQADLDRDEVRRAPPALEQVLGQGRGARVVGDARRAGRCARVRIEASGRSCQSRLTAQRIVPVVGVHEARRPDADAEERAGLGRQRDQRVDEAGQRGQGVVAVEAVRRDLARRAGPRRGGRRARRRTRARRGRRAITRRASSTTWSRIGALPPLEGPRPISRTRPSAMTSDDELADGGPGEAGEAGDLGAADRAVVVQRAQDEAAVEPTRLLVGGLARQRHSPSPSSDTRPPGLARAPRGPRRLCQVS